MNILEILNNMQNTDIAMPMNFRGKLCPFLHLFLSFKSGEHRDGLKMKDGGIMSD